MPRRKQDCPKRMKWEGGEETAGGEEGGGGGGGGDDESRSSATSPPPDEDVVGDPDASPRSLRSLPDDLTPMANHHHLSGERDTTTSPPISSSPPSGESPFSLPPTLPTAAMAAYLAAAAAQQHSLMMTSPLPPPFSSGRSSISPLVTSSSSPPATSGHPPHSPPSSSDGGILDFSKRSLKSGDQSDHSDCDAMNLSKSISPPAGEPLASTVNSPLDLSVSSTRKRSADEHATTTTHPPPARKARTSTAPGVPTWTPPVVAQHLPYFAAAVAAASLSPKTSASTTDVVWNGKMKTATPPSDASKALEKMSELSRLGGDDLFRTLASGGGGGGGAAANSASSRHSAWQSHWLNKGAEQAKDVLKCVWCKQSFPSLAAMTTHMKEAKHCGVNVPVPPMTVIPPTSGGPSPTCLPSAATNTTNTSTSNHAPSKQQQHAQNDLNLLIKETMPLPRKLVRGQDVWLGKGAEQTRQILKCMWCGQSFRSLAEMTSHMQQTQHYTNIISQEQIISWRSTDDSKNGGSGGGGGGGGGGSGGPGAGGGGGGGAGGGGGGAPPGSASSHVSAVLTCKVCDQAFSSLKELSNHMVKNSHYKEHIMRSITESGGRRRQTREKRKKSLPVRKLLELERAQHEFKNGDSGSVPEKRDAVTTTPPTTNTNTVVAAAGRITCEKCGNKIETSIFVDHIRQCVGMTSNQRNFLKNALMTPNTVDKSSPSPKETTSPPTSTCDTNNGSAPSVLNAIEKLIEKSFDSRGRQNASFAGQGSATAPMGASILKRLGIDESVDYTKPLVDAQTMSLLRSYHHQTQQQQQHFAPLKRERSGSESSSISERGSSRVDALSPDRKMEPPGVPLPCTPRSTPDAASDAVEMCNSIKKEAIDESPPIEVKKEAEDGVDDDDRSSVHSNGPMGRVEESERKHLMVTSPQRVRCATLEKSPCRNSSSSPASSDRSATPRSTNGDRKLVGGGSLGALSSMFDSLSGTPSSECSTTNTTKRTSSHPLAALQKLCDKTETQHTTNNRATSTTAATTTTTTSTTASATTPGAILAFSWACNDAVMTSDSILKCAFCDTPFISKGAYRHHLSKMHFVKDGGAMPDPVALKAAAAAGGQPSGSGASTPGGKSTMGTTSGPGSTGSKSPSPPGGGGAPVGGSGGSTFEESPHSKFLKYTELAKQLSSKYV